MHTFFGFIGPRTSEMAANTAIDLMARSGMLLSPPARAALMEIMGQAIIKSMVGLDRAIIGRFEHGFIEYSCKRTARRPAGVRLNHPSLSVEGLNLYNLIGKLIERQYRLYAVMQALNARYEDAVQEQGRQGEPAPIMPTLDVREISNLVLADPSRVIARLNPAAVFASYGIELTQPLVDMVSRVAEQAIAHALTCDAAKPGAIEFSSIGGYSRVEAFFTGPRAGTAQGSLLELDVRIHDGRLHVSSGRTLAFVATEDSHGAQLAEAIAWTHSRWVEVQEELLSIGREADNYLDKLGTNMAMGLEKSQAVALAG